MGFFLCLAVARDAHPRIFNNNTIKFLIIACLKYT